MLVFTGRKATRLVAWLWLFFCSLALALPKYSEHFIQAKLGDDMKQAMCEYSFLDFSSARSRLPGMFLAACAQSPLVSFHLFLAGTTATPIHVPIGSDPRSAFLL